MCKEPDYKYLIKRFTTDENKGEDIIKARYVSMEKRALAFLAESKLENSVYLHHGILNIVMLDYFADIARLKDFEDGLERTNKNKITAYMSYWWLRRKPLQVIQEVDAEYQNKDIPYINEKFIATLIAKDFMYQLNNTYFTSKQCKECINHLFYHLKYRIYTAQTLELFLMGINTGIEIEK